MGRKLKFAANTIPQRFCVLFVCRFCFAIQFEKYREAHTVDDASYLRDMHEWDGNVAAQKKIVAGLQAQADALRKVRLLLKRKTPEKKN